MIKNKVIYINLFLASFLLSSTYCFLRSYTKKVSTHIFSCKKQVSLDLNTLNFKNRENSDSLLVPVEFNNVTSALRIFPFIYYGYISRLNLSNLNKELVENRLEEIYPFLEKKNCGNFNCLFFFEPKAGSSMTVTTLSWLLSFSTLSSNVSPILLQYATGLPQALFFGTKLSQYQIIISPIQILKQGEVFAKIVPSEENLKHDLLVSPCDGVLQYVWPNISTPSIAFMLIARIQCNKQRNIEKTY